MTRELAIGILEMSKHMATSGRLYNQAIDMAIEALQFAEHFDLLKEFQSLQEVVRCKDCRWWNEDDFPRAFPEKKTSACEVPNIYGANFSRYTQEDEFCSRGERREDAT